ncbi:MAG TPA: hypothetical protein VG267_02675 [Terracidiphilus sp.]|jgi:hypothetical protein|nr:hypothetical protein [Terracidiphilus sp.]
MSRLKLIAVELAMLGWIFALLYALPESTPLLAYLAGSAVFLAIGNFLLIKTHRELKGLSDPKRNFYTRLFKVFAILNIVWVLTVFMKGR